MTLRFPPSRALGGGAACAALVVLALTVRLAYLWQDTASPLFGYGGIDSSAYHLNAVGFANGTWPDQRAFFHGPGYPLALGCVYRLCGESLLTAKVVQAVLGSLSCLLVVLIARTLFPSRFVAWAAGITCSLCGPLVYFDGQIGSASLDVFLQLLVLLLLLAAAGRALWWWFLTGVVIGLSAITRGGILLYLPLVLVWMARLCGRPDGRVRRFLPRAALLVLPVSLVILPVSWHNLVHDQHAATDSSAASTATTEGGSRWPTLEKLVSGRFAPISWNLGINLYLGNSWALREVSSVGHPLCLVHYRRLLERPFRRGEHTYSGHSRYLTRETLRMIADRPLDWLRLVGLKVLQLLNGDERPRDSNAYADRRYSWVLGLLLWKHGIAFPSGLLIPLGLVGVGLALRSGRGHFLPLALLGAQALFVLAFFVTSRYRLPSLPLLSIYAAFAVEHLAAAVRRGEARLAALPAGALLGLLLVGNLGAGAMSSSHSPYEFYHVGEIEEAEGHGEKALDCYRHALTLDPSFPPAMLKLGLHAEQSGQLEQAIAHYREVLRTAPMDTMARNHLATVLLTTGDLDQSEASFRELLRLEPNVPEAHARLAWIYETRHQPAEAIYHYSELVRLQPANADAHVRLAQLLAARGELTEAAVHCEKALEANPRNAEARSLLRSLCLSEPRK